MFAITSEQRQYQTYVLTDAASSAALEVVPERGGIITSWKLGGQELLYLDVERFSHPELTVRGGIPILFPTCGNLPDNLYRYAGQAYSLKQHGFARDLPWQVVATDTQAAAALTLELTSNQQTRQGYPFEFQLRFTYELQGQSLTLRQQHTNLSDRPMPFASGLHPYFSVANKAQLQFQIPASHYQDQRSQAQQPFSGFDFELDEIDVAFRPLSQQSAQVIDPERGLRLSLDYDPAYSTLVFWTIKGKDYYCLEPWTAPRNALNTGDSLLVLEPGQSLETVVRLRAEFVTSGSA
ncbi:MAG: aldose epimerase [Elainella sp.]